MACGTPFKAESLVYCELRGIVRIILFRFLVTRILLKWHAEPDLGGRRSELSVLSFTEAFKKSGNIVTDALVERGLAAVGIGLGLAVQLNQHVALHFPNSKVLRKKWTTYPPSGWQSHDAHLYSAPGSFRTSVGRLLNGVVLTSASP